MSCLYNWLNMLGERDEMPAFTFGDLQLRSCKRSSFTIQLLRLLAWGDCTFLSWVARHTVSCDRRMERMTEGLLARTRSVRQWWEEWLAEDHLEDRTTLRIGGSVREILGKIPWMISVMTDIWDLARTANQDFQMVHLAGWWCRGTKPTPGKVLFASGGSRLRLGLLALANVSWGFSSWPQKQINN